MIDPDEVREIRRDKRGSSTVDLLDDFVLVTQRLEIGQPVEVCWMEFRATWQELSRRGFLQVQ